MNIEIVINEKKKTHSDFTKKLNEVNLKLDKNNKAMISLISELDEYKKNERKVQIK